MSKDSKYRAMKKAIRESGKLHKKEFKPDDPKLTGKVANNHGRFDVEEIGHYFKTGDIDETSI